MHLLKYSESSNNQKVAELINNRIAQLKATSNKGDFRIGNTFNRIGNSTTHINRIRNTERELFNVHTIYGISRELGIPINELVKTYLGLSDKEEVRCFYITNTEYASSNAAVLKNAASSLAKRRGCRKVTQAEIAKTVGCTPSHMSHVMRGLRSMPDIRMLYRLSALLEIPLYPLIRNELGVTTEDLAKIINLPHTERVINLSIFVNDDESLSARKELFKIISVIDAERLPIVTEVVTALARQ